MAVERRGRALFDGTGLMRQLPFAGDANLGAADAMTKTQRYELTHEQVLEICQALKFQADAFDHQEGS